MRVLDELRGSLASFRCAAKRSSGATDMSSVVALSAARLTAYCATIFSRLAFRLIWLFFAMIASVREWELEALQKRFCFRIGLRSGVDDDVHAPHGFRLVVVDFDERHVFLETHREIAAAVEALAVQPAEVAHARQRHGDETVEEFVHAVLAQRDLHADRPAHRDLERRDRLLRLGDDRLLSGD